MAVFGIMKTRYRKDVVSSEVIAKLPTVDKTPAETLRRAQALSILWGKLPNPPGSLTPFKAWDTMDKAAFDALLAALWWPGSALFVVTTLVTYFGWRLDLD